MTLRTLTIDTRLAKVVPVSQTREMVEAVHEAAYTHRAAAWKVAEHARWSAQLAAVPDTLPGVIEHSGDADCLPTLPEPFAKDIFANPRYEWRFTSEQMHDYARAAISRSHKSPAQPVERQELSDAATDVLAERRRQVDAEGWTPEHDDEHSSGAMANAAACYALHTEPVGNVGDYLRFWPWVAAWWKPKDRRRNLVKAGALILAEIERLDRAKDRGQA